MTMVIMASVLGPELEGVGVAGDVVGLVDRGAKPAREKKERVIVSF